MDVVKIEDQESFEAWLNSLPQGTKAEQEESQRWAVLIAHRAAMRVLPVFWAWTLDESTRNGGLKALPVLRANMISGVAGTCPTPPIRDAARSAAFSAARSAADSAAAAVARSAFSTADSAARSAFSAAATRSAFAARSAADAAAAAAFSAAESEPAAAARSTSSAAWSALSWDCSNLIKGRDINGFPLWPDQNPCGTLWAITRRKLFAQGSGWHFWVNWYDRTRKGETQDWLLLTKVALIDPLDWESGPNHLNKLIADIIHDHVAGGSENSGPASAVNVKRIRQNVLLNAAPLAMQIEALLELAEKELQRIRGLNSLDADIRDGLVAAFDQLKAAAEAIGSYLPRAAVLTEADAEALLSWGGVLKEASQRWNHEAKKFVSCKPADPNVVLGCRIGLAALVAGPLAFMGLGPFAAVAGGAILFKDKLGDLPKVIESLRKGTPPS